MFAVHELRLEPPTHAWINLHLFRSVPFKCGIPTSNLGMGWVRLNANCSCFFNRRKIPESVIGPERPKFSTHAVRVTMGKNMVKEQFLLGFVDSVKDPL